jgi:2-polyprenyl-3-methyl-5-hydroxy-6-metoxy-1,4-benzoquinol methylase
MELKKIELKKMPRTNVVLKERRSIYEAVNLISKLGMPYHKEIIEKNWDALSCMRVILENTEKTDVILDAGGRINSIFPDWLTHFGYKTIKVMNLEFDFDNVKRIAVGKNGRVVEYVKGDITKTNFEDNEFSAVICTSVIEHGVDEDAFLKEMYRILKPKGVLFISTDYWKSPIDTSGEHAYGNQIYIYDEKALLNFVNKAKTYNLKIHGPKLDLKCGIKAVYWKKHRLSYTFVSLTFQKSNKGGN